MAYFPFFMELEDTTVLIVGGGHVALRKAEHLLPYGPNLRVIAPVFCPEFTQLPRVQRTEKIFTPSDLDGVSFVIAATDDAAQNRHISALCQQTGIPVNVVDDKQACTFLFPALVRRGPLSVGISTAGASPSASVWLKEQIDALLPARLDEILLWLEEQRPILKEQISDASVRSTLFTSLFTACMEKGAPLTSTELQTILSREVSSHA